jgi:SNF2 family DNA or RNA helicase
VHELVVDDTIDIDVLELLSQKLEVSAEAIDGRLNTGTEGRTSIGQLLLDRMRKPKVEKIPQKA